MHWRWWTRFLWTNAAYLSHKSVEGGSCRWWPRPEASKPGLSPEVELSEQSLQQLQTSPSPPPFTADRALQPESARWTFEPDTNSWVVWGGCMLCRWRVASLECGGSLLRRFHSWRPFDKGLFLQFGQNYEPVRGVQNPAAWPGLCWWSWMEGFSVDLKCLQTEQLGCKFFHCPDIVHFDTPWCVTADHLWSVLGDRCRSRLPAP